MAPVLKLTVAPTSTKMPVSAHNYYQRYRTFFDDGPDYDGGQYDGGQYDGGQYDGGQCAYASLDNDQLRAGYRRQPYIPPSPTSPLTAPLPLNLEAHYYKYPAPPETKRETNFLNSNVLTSTRPGVPQKPELWQGVEILGSGGEGIVGMWETIGLQADPGVRYNRVAMKKSKKGNNLDNEDMMMEKLQHKPSNHCVRKFESGRSDSSEQHVDRILVEYCPLGEMSGLITRRHKEQEKFKERTLWRMFNCLLDGIAQMRDGREMRWNAATRTAKREPVADPPHMVHFDLKPTNLFLARDELHGDVPIVKIGDFGLAICFEEDIDFPWNVHEWEMRQFCRLRGTWGLHPPEQFTGRWDASDFQAPTLDQQVAGNFSWKTNLWGIAAIMVQLIVLREEYPRPHQFFIPPGGKGVTWGIDLAPEPYSDTLKNLLGECLYEIPSHRPELEELKERIMDGIRDSDAADPIPEPWIDFLLHNDDLVLASIDAKEQAIADGQQFAGVLVHCNKIPGAKGCGRKAISDGTHAKSRCSSHRPPKMHLPLRPAAPQNYYTGATIRCKVGLPKQCKNTFATNGIIVTCPNHGSASDWSPP